MFFSNAFLYHSFIDVQSCEEQCIKQLYVSLILCFGLGRVVRKRPAASQHFGSSHVTSELKKSPFIGAPEEEPLKVPLQNRFT